MRPVFVCNEYPVPLGVDRVFRSEIIHDRDYMRSGLNQPFVVIEDALWRERAERLYEDLVSYKGWTREDRDEDNASFVYSRYVVGLETSNLPESVASLYEYLRSEECLRWISDASGIRCDDFEGSAALLLGGDRLKEHNDHRIEESGGKITTRSVTFNYYLTRDWSKEWGGQFVWLNPYTEIFPGFNRLVLFRVGPDSAHRVQAVSPAATVPRVAITGWYTTSRERNDFHHKLDLKLG